ncbi:MAG: YARHG domain-containing protein [Blautia sp.]|nr:YARHG domain-containing protein [Lachnoclostridium sp.]MCM1210801.1 YARHG domain-containing protein [Blautia sp.]
MKRKRFAVLFLTMFMLIAAGYTQKGKAKDSTYTWNEMTISIPASWEGKYLVEKSKDGFTLFQSASYEKEKGMGFLCGFYRVDGMVIDVPGGTPLAYTATQTYYMVEPTDVAYYYEDKTISAQYHAMYDCIEEIVASFDVRKEGVQYNPEEYIFPLSNTMPVEEEYLLNCSDDQLSIARNEIYARHGRKFDNVYLANYFASCSWYEGTLSPKEFDEAVFSQIEKDNLEIIKKAEAEYKAEHPYPKEYKEGIRVREDLDGDGDMEQIRYSVKEQNANGLYEGSLVIDGKKYVLEDYCFHSGALVDTFFYVTDISPFYEGLEIAILDYGPSEDWVTHFFTYQDGLTYLGNVGGFPFKRLSGYNGFANGGAVIGEVRLDFTHTSHAFGSWWYDYANQELKYQDTLYYNYIPDGAHQLHEDITIYTTDSLKSAKIVLPAQDEVFFLGTDGKEWTYLKGKDGTKGYMRIKNGKVTGTSKEAQELFSGLSFYD